MPAIHAFEGTRYMFAPTAKRGKKGPQAIIVSEDGTLGLNFHGKTEAAARKAFAAFSKDFSAEAIYSALDCPEGTNVVLRKVYDAAPEASLKKLCRLGYISKADLTEALGQCERLHMFEDDHTPSSKPAAKQPRGLNIEVRRAVF
ncbi:MAG TPA: hypothetical protein VHB73_07235 [Alphaproteobacteria bacterium]|nr:hypothetical protein [Alphaproteobacteria bacterium]